MRHRFIFGALLLACSVVPLTSCTNDVPLTSITINPGSVTTSMTEGLQVHFTAIGSYTRAGHTPITKDITNEVTWSTAFPQFVTIASTGVATVTGYGYGDGNIYASAPGFHGDIVGSATFTIQQPTTTGAITSLSIVQHALSNGTVQFTAMGKTNDGRLVQLEGQPRWTATDNLVATIDQASGLATTIGRGRSTITAVYTNPDGTTAVGVTHLDVAPE
jgi:hypothetical protein